MTSHAAKVLVLIIDDETAIRRLIIVTLESDGYRVAEAPTMQDGKIIDSELMRGISTISCVASKESCGLLEKHDGSPRARQDGVVLTPFSFSFFSTLRELYGTALSTNKHGLAPLCVY